MRRFSDPPADMDDLLSEQKKTNQLLAEIVNQLGTLAIFIQDQKEIANPQKSESYAGMHILKNQHKPRRSVPTFTPSDMGGFGYSGGFGSDPSTLTLPKE